MVSVYLDLPLTFHFRNEQEIANPVDDLLDMWVDEGVMSGHELILGRQGRCGCTEVAWPHDPQGSAFPYTLCADREMSRDMTLDQPHQAFAFPKALHGSQAMERRALRRVFDELAHDQSRFRGRIEFANAFAQPGKKTDGEFVHDRHSKFLLRLEVVRRQLVRHARVLGSEAPSKPNVARPLVAWRDSTVLVAKKILARWQIFVLYNLPMVKHDGP